jgi:hypothetical protein
MHECLHLRSDYLQYPPLLGIPIEDDLLINHAYQVSSEALFYELVQRVPPLRDVLPCSLEDQSTIPWEFCEELARYHFRRTRSPTDFGFNLITFLREARELKGLMRHILEYKKTLKKVISFCRKSGMTMRQFVRRVAEEHLTWAFGILPLISDLESVMDILKRHEETIKNIVGGHHSTYRYGKSNLKSRIKIPADIGNIGKFRDVGQDWLVTYEWLTEPNWKGYYTYYVRAAPIVKKPYGGFLVLLQELGVQPDPKILWDAIPFSFILDWVLDLGQTLHSNRLDWVPITMNITDSMHHVQWTLSRVYWNQQFPGSTYARALSEQWTVFQRRRFIAETSARQGLKQVGIDKLALAASLIAVH